MANCQAKTPQALEDFIYDTLVGLSEEHKVTLRGSSNAKRFEFFINDVAEKGNGSVVILLDEYDKPILNTLSGPVRICRYLQFQPHLQVRYRSFPVRIPQEKPGTVKTFEKISFLLPFIFLLRCGSFCTDLQFFLVCS